MGVEILTYCGGMAAVSKTGDMVVSVLPNYIEICVGLFKKSIIPYETITGVSMKTDEQISKDVTLTRLLLLGVFAFGAKKKTKTVTNYLVIDYIDNGIGISAIFTGDKVPKTNADILTCRANFLKRNPPKQEPITIMDSSSGDAYSEIERLHSLLEKGIITETEFASKKQQLLGI